MGSRGNVSESAMEFTDELFGLKRATSSTTTASGVSDVSQSTDGCLVLGTDAKRGNRYVTRFRIDRGIQRDQLVGDIFKEECLPCCQPSKRTTCKKFAWTLFTAEPLLLTLHMSAVALGAIKEGLNMRTEAEDLHLAASCVETYVALQIMVARLAAGWGGFQRLKKERAKVEYIQQSGGDISNPHLKRALWLFTALMILLLLGDITAFICFYFRAHLGWTILSNNFCIGITSAAAGILTARLTGELAGINEDQHKAVVYESILLLTECAWSKGAQEQQKIFAKVDRFCKALRDTERFEKPDYITLPDGLKPKMDLLSTLELQSIV